jgi:NADH oxidase (H2O2-forming)
MAKSKVAVIGNGIAGFSSASTIKRLDDGSDVTVFSEESVPLYSACVLPNYISGSISRERVFVRDLEDYKRLGLRTIFGCTVKEIDRVAKKVFTSDGQIFSFDKLVFATGSEAVLFGERKKGIFKLKSLKDADDLLAHKGRRAVVVGSGAIGLEVAIALHLKGYKVAVIEMLESLLPMALDKHGAEKVREIIEGQGIEVYLGESATVVVGGESVQGLVTSRRSLECDTLIWAVGMRPRVTLARELGLKLGEKGGIRVDSHMETSFPGIYACGDCVETDDMFTGAPSLNLFWHNANRQGAIAARNCIGLRRAYPGSQNILNVDLFGNHVVGFGHTETAMRRSCHKNGDDPTDLSVIEKEEVDRYFRIVLFKDRCVGAQFINVEKDLGLVLNIMSLRKELKSIQRVFDKRTSISQKGWLGRINPLFLSGK